MRKSKSTSLRGSVTQNNISVRIRDDNASSLGLVNRLGLLAVGLIVLVFAVGWAFNSSWPSRQYENAKAFAVSLTQKARFSVQDITVEGRVHANREEILDTLAVSRGTPILTFDSYAAAEKLRKLNWIDSVTVERRLPDSINVVLKEKRPIARWQRDDRAVVIDDQGQIMPSAKIDDFPSLPVVVGTGANESAEGLLVLLAKFPEIQNKMTSAVRVGERRWDIHLMPKVIVRMPEDGLQNALRRLSLLVEQEKILDRDIVAIDLRIPDRLVIEPGAAATPAPAPTGGSRP